MPKFTTALRVDESGTGIPIAIEYERRKAWLSPGRESPDEPAHCTVTNVITDDGIKLDLGFLVDHFNADPELQSALMADWDADDADHEERRGDAARKGEL